LAESIRHPGEPLRVLIASDTFPPDINGAARFTERLAGGLVRNGNNVHVIAPAIDKNFESDEVFTQEQMLFYSVMDESEKYINYLNEII
jgi:hypothetical protein